MNIKTVVIAGASGVVGSRLLPLLLERPDVGQVVALGRRTLPIEHAKLRSRVVDLGDVASLTDAMPAEVSVAICSLGTTMRQAGSRAAFRAVDHDAVVAFAEAAKRHGAKRFLLVSSLGADALAKNFYLRTKGEAEDACERLGFSSFVVARPSILDAGGGRRDRRIGEAIGVQVMRALGPLIGRQSRWAAISVDVVARALVRLAFDPGVARRRIVLSDELHGLGA